MNWLRVSFFTLVVALFAVANLPWQLDDYDQAKQAYTSFEMVHGGAWLIQHSPKGEIATKPPLAGWISAAFYLPLRSWEVAWRLPSLLAALWLLWRLTRDGTLLAGAAFAFNGFTPRLATLVRNDMLLALFMTLIGLRIYEKIRDRSPWSTRDRWFIFACVLASMMVKGPILYAFFFPGLLAFWWRQRRRGETQLAWCGWWPWLLPLIGFGAWAAWGISTNADFYHRVVEQEFLGRFQTGEQAVHEAKPVYVYLTKLLAMFAPWMWLLLAVPFVPELRRKIAARPELLWLVGWTLGGLLVMSLVPSKRADRIFPLIPPACLLIGALFAHGPETPLLWRRLAQVSAMVACLGTFFYAGWNLFFDRRDDAAALARFGQQARTYAAAHAQPLAIVSGNDQGLLLYAHQLQFTDEKPAAEAWRRHENQAIILPKKVWERRRARFPGARVIFEVKRTVSTFSEYVFLTR